MSDIDVPLEKPSSALEGRGFLQMRLTVMNTHAIMRQGTNLTPGDPPGLGMTQVTATGLGSPEEITFGVLHRLDGMAPPVAGDEIEVSVRWPV